MASAGNRIIVVVTRIVEASGLAELATVDYGLIHAKLLDLHVPRRNNLVFHLLERCNIRPRMHTNWKAFIIF